MNLCNKSRVNFTILIIGLLVYCCQILSSDFVLATVTMMTSLLLWLGFNLYNETFDKLIFSKILSTSGIILSISIFFLFGIEEVPFPIGALLFHIDGIAISLFIILLSTLPILFFTQGHPSYSTANSQSSYVEESKADSHTDESLDDSWEIATDEDIESGNYEVAA